MKSFYKIVAIACLMLFTVQCEVIDSDLLDSPNAPSPENVDPNLLLNNIQMNARSVYSGASSLGGEMTRMRYMFGSTYGNAYTASSFNGVYQNAYSNLFIDVKNLLPIAENRGLYFHNGIAKTLQAYALITLVDVFGDVPYSEALDDANFNPRVDDGADVYAAALALLDEAIADLRNPDRVVFPATDLYFGHISIVGDPDEVEPREEAWVRTANTIKLKAYLNTGNAAGIAQLIDEDLLITHPDHNFTFSFDTQDTNPDARHPNFANSYENLPTGGNYMAVNYMNMMLNDKPMRDPRMRYYFYRQQVFNTTNVEEQSCLAAFPPAHFQEDDPFCQLEDGYWGRDHLIDDGIPPDTPLRTTFGVYPVGGEYDNNQNTSVTSNMGYRGAGFDPILMSFFTHFMLAEAALELGTAGDPLSLLETAVIGSMEAVRDFGADRVDELGASPAITADAIDAYWAAVESNYTEQGPLRTIIKEYYLALWPNGLEAYNAMRRTGYPNRDDNLQPARTASPGDWYRTFSYPANMIERNANVSAKPSRLIGPFWDPRDGSDEFNF